MEHKFVDTIPGEIEDNVLYISLKYNVTKHLCPCGCGSEIVATLSPARYQLYYDGETVSLTPSFGNWLHECRSHYLIKKDKVVWAKSMPKHKSDAVIKRDQKELKEYINTKKKYKHKSEATIQKDQQELNTKKESLFERIKNKLLKRLNLN